jgi:hypothetical protein
MKNNSFLIENFEEILLQKSFEDLNEAEREQLRLEKISAQEYTAMREMLLQMQDIDENEIVPNDAIKTKLMAEFVAPTKIATKGKIISLNSWFYMGIAASLAIVFTIFYKVSENVTNTSEKNVAQKIESDSSTNTEIPKAMVKNSTASEVYTNALADTLSNPNLPAAGENNIADEFQISETTPLVKAGDRSPDAEKEIQPAPSAESIKLADEIKFEAATRNQAADNKLMKSHTAGVSLAEIPQLNSITIEIY